MSDPHGGYAPAPEEARRPSRAPVIITAIFAVALGAITAGVGTFIHGAHVVVAGAAIPVGVVGALALLAMALTGLRLIWPTRLAAGLGGGGALIAMALLMIPTPSGTVLVAESVLGYVWLLGAVLVMAVVIAWPRIARATSPLGAA